MNIKSLASIKYDNKKGEFNLFETQIIFDNLNLSTYEVQQSEEMRPDLVMLSIYDEDASVLESMDVFLYINGIDNPLNIIEGDILLYPSRDKLDSLRVAISNNGTDITSQLSVPNKTTKIDSNRKTYQSSGYSLPPVVLEKPKSPVSVNNGQIIIGGLN